MLWSIFLIWFFSGLGIAYMLIRQGSWILFFGSICLTAYGGLAALESIRQGSNLNNPSFEYAGHALLLFFSVLGGGLVSTALSEIRHNIKSSHNSSRN